MKWKRVVACGGHARLPNFFLGAAENEADGAGAWGILEFLDVLDHGDQDGGVLLEGAGVFFLLGSICSILRPRSVLVASSSRSLTNARTIRMLI